VLGKKVGIDLGTSCTRVVARGEGIVASEPTVVAVNDRDTLGGTHGSLALEDSTRKAELRLMRPVVGGAVVDADAARALIGQVIARAVGRQRIFKPDVVIAVMSGMPGEQRRALLEAATLAGARTVYLLDVPIAAAMGAGMRLSGTSGHLVIDVGAGKTDIAVLALEGTISGICLAGHGGERLADAITDHVSREHGVALTSPVVEDVIASLARVGAHEERRLEVEGTRGPVTATVTITSTELASRLEEHVRPITAALDEVFTDTPAALRDDIAREGGVLCGGAARLEGLDLSLSSAAGFAVRVVGEPQLTTVRGTGYALDNLDVLKRTFMYIR